MHTVAGSGTTTDEFVYDGLDLLAMNRGGAVYQQYVHGPGIDQPLALLDYSSGSLAVYYYHADRLGSIRALTDAAQAVAQSYTYTAFGVTTVGTPGGLDQPFRYTAREWDTAAGLYYYRARWYDAEAGRFVSPDPIGFAGGFANLFVYVANSPLSSTDPSGLFPGNVSELLGAAVIRAKLAARVVLSLLRSVGTRMRALKVGPVVIKGALLGAYHGAAALFTQTLITDLRPPSLSALGQAAAWGAAFGAASAYLAVNGWPDLGIAGLNGVGTFVLAKMDGAPLPVAIAAGVGGGLAGMTSLKTLDLENFTLSFATGIVTGLALRFIGGFFPAEAQASLNRDAYAWGTPGYNSLFGSVVCGQS